MAVSLRPKEIIYDCFDQAHRDRALGLVAPSRADRGTAERMASPVGIPDLFAFKVPTHSVWGFCFAGLGC